MPLVSVRQAIEQATAHMHADQLPQAERICRQILLRQPNHFGVLHLLGLVLHRQGQLDEALALYRKSVDLHPDDPMLLHHFGVALQQAGSWAMAEQCSRKVISLQPGFHDAYANLAATLHALGRFQEAEEACHQAISLQPESADDYNRLGTVLNSQGRLDEAAASYLKALSIQPGLPEVLCNLGSVYLLQGRVDEAADCARKALAILPAAAAMHSNLLFTLQFSPSIDPAALRAEHDNWATRHARPLYSQIRPQANTCDPARRLRIGYVSPNLRGHIIGMLLETFLVHHDRQQVFTACYSDTPYRDGITQSLQQHSDLWRDTAGLSDQQLADQIRQDQIDILVDLNLHMAQNRLLVFARKPAPVQVTYLGYPATTGLETIDYRLTDPYLSPPDAPSEGPEKLVHLPHGYWCYKPLPDAPPVNDLPAMNNGHITFGCFNNFAKVNAGVIALWSSLLKLLPQSQLHLLIPGGPRNTRVYDSFQAHGIDPQRLRLFDRQSGPEYLKLHHAVDIALDPFPYNGHTTSYDALYMGVPLVTLTGQRAVSRAGLSILTNLNLTELVARSPEQYVQIATSLAADLPRLADLRRTLRPRLEQSPLMDAPRFARDIEAAYRQMWLTYCQLPH
jgi:predicted O-linked N-acetylglucosamine transferase (SPINDLY family)